MAQRFLKPAGSVRATDGGWPIRNRAARCATRGNELSLTCHVDDYSRSGIKQKAMCEKVPSVWNGSGYLRPVATVQSRKSRSRTNERG